MAYAELTHGYILRDLPIETLDVLAVRNEKSALLILTAKQTVIRIRFELAEADHIATKFRQLSLPILTTDAVQRTTGENNTGTTKKTA